MPLPSTRKTMPGKCAGDGELEYPLGYFNRFDLYGLAFSNSAQRLHISRESFLPFRASGSQSKLLVISLLQGHGMVSSHKDDM